MARYEAAERLLDALGADGWELVAVDNAGPGESVYLFKRRKS